MRCLLDGQVALELFRIMVQMPPPKATIMLGAVAGEEQGLFGSTFFAQQMKTAGKDVQGMFTNDIVGSSKSDQGVVDANNIRLFAQGIPDIATLAQVRLFSVLSSKLFLTLVQAQARASIGGENDSPARELARFVSNVATNSFTNMTGAFRGTLRVRKVLNYVPAQSVSSIVWTASCAAVTTALSWSKASLLRASPSRTRTSLTSTKTFASTRTLASSSATSSSSSTWTSRRA